MGTVKGRESLDRHRECLHDRDMLGVKDLVKGHLYGSPVRLVTSHRPLPLKEALPVSRSPAGLALERAWD